MARLGKVRFQGVTPGFLIMNDKEKIKKEAKAFALARFTTAIHYIKRFYTKEEAFEILELYWQTNCTQLPYD